MLQMAATLEKAEAELCYAHFNAIQLQFSTCCIQLNCYVVI